MQCIYGRPGQDLLVSQIACPVLHHNVTPTWYEEIKLRLPLGLFPEHHLLFSFYHVSCNLSKKRDANAAFETPIGYAWLPLLQKNRICLEEQQLPVAATLPVGYLSIQPLGWGKGVSCVRCVLRQVVHQLMKCLFCLLPNILHTPCIHSLACQLTCALFLCSLSSH